MLDEMAISHNNSCVRTKVGYSAGKHYNTYRTNSAGKNLNSLNSLKLISRCQKNKILIELDNKGVDNNSGCNTKGMHKIVEVVKLSEYLLSIAN